MKGSIIRRGDKFSIVIDVGRDAFGKRKQRWFSGYNSYKEAENELPRILVKIQDGELIDNNPITLGKFATDWLEHKIKYDKIADTTRAGYTNIINKHIIPTMGTLKMQEIKPYNLQKYFESKLTNKDNPLSVFTLNNHHRVLKSIFIYAEDMGIVEKNPMNKVKVPKDKKTETRVLTIDESQRLLDIVQHNDFLKMPVSLALLLGLRRGECLGLSWDKVDFKNKLITIDQNLEYIDKKLIFKEPKTLKSNRKIAITDSVVTLLKEHKKWQLEMTMRSGGVWKNEYNLVCTRKTDGSPVTPHVLSTCFKKFLIKNQLPEIRFHDLRHTNATIMLAANISAKVAGNRLGHSNTSITLDLYSHVLESIDRDVADKIEQLIKVK